MLVIKIKEGETIEKALRRYKKKFEKTGILKETRSRMYFSKPSEDRVLKMKKARSRERYFVKENY